MVLNVFITVFISYLTYSDYIFHGAALVALPCSLFHCLIAVCFLLSYLLCLLMYNKIIKNINNNNPYSALGITVSASVTPVQFHLIMFLHLRRSIASLSFFLCPNQS